MHSRINRLITSLPENLYEEALILLSQEDYQGIRKIARKMIKDMTSLINVLSEELMDEEDCEDE